MTSDEIKSFTPVDKQSALARPAGSFHFVGSLPASKSLMNRALIIQSYANEMKINGESDAEDVKLMQAGLARLLTPDGAPIDCGHAGTVLRFLAMRASRIPGEHRLTGSERLFSRPQNELTPILAQLGVHAQFTQNEMRIQSKGWRLMVDGLQVNAERSSQFASALLLNCWELPSPLHFSLSRRFVSEGYWQMTVRLMRDWGMNVEMRGHEVFVPARAKVKMGLYTCEPDLSSAFSVAAAAAVAGEAQIQNFPMQSLQPDRVFVRILKDMGVDIRQEGTTLNVHQAAFLQGVHADLNSTPDLFPILAVLCGMARTPSQLDGIAHLQHKESKRLEKTLELLHYMGAKALVSDDGNSVEIQPRSLNFTKSQISYNPDQDHRMAMAAEILRLSGYPIHVQAEDVVKKSFPNFFRLTRGQGDKT